MKENWKKLLRMDVDIPPNLMRTYAKFLIDVVNDKELAKGVIDKLHVVYSNSTKRGR